MSWVKFTRNTSRNRKHYPKGVVVDLPADDIKALGANVVPCDAPPATAQHAPASPPVKVKAKAEEKKADPKPAPAAKPEAEKSGWFGKSKADDSK